MWTNGSVEGITLKIVAQNTVGHRVNVVSTLFRDISVTGSNRMLLVNESDARHLLTAVSGCPQFLLAGDLQACITVYGVKVCGNYWSHLL